MKLIIKFDNLWMWWSLLNKCSILYDLCKLIFVYATTYNHVVRGLFVVCTIKI
jgi:hypothetical protein